MTQKAARLFEEGKPGGPESSAAKFFGSEVGFDAADRAMQFHGGYSMSTEYHLSRFWMEARRLKIAPISHKMVLNLISDKVLGLPKSHW
jgi:acyl-CoA dehydrogenase